MVTIPPNQYSYYLMMTKEELVPFCLFQLAVISWLSDAVVV